MTINRAIALRISNLINFHKISQYELSKRSTVEQSTINRILSEETKEIKIQTILKIAYAFQLTLEQFFSDKLFNENNIEVF